MQRYLKLFLLTLTVTLAAIVSTNILVDPFDIFRTGAFPQLEKTRRDADGARIATGFDIVRGGYRTLFLGNSRMKRMIKGQVKELPGHELNAGLAGGNIFEIVRAGRLAFGKPGLTCVYVGLDFNGFSSIGGVKGSYAISPLAGGPYWLSRIKVALSLDSLRRSVDTLRDHLGTVDSAPALQPGEPRERFLAMTRNFLGVYRSTAYDPERVRFLAAMIDRFTRDGVQVIGLISPVHAWHEEAMFAAGMGQDYLRWRRDVAQAFHASAERSARNPCASSSSAALLYDFAGYRPLSQTHVPDEKTATSDPWYDESSHVTPLIGHAMILHTMGRATGLPFTPLQLAEILTPENLETNEGAMLARREAYRKSPDGKTIAPLLTQWQATDAPEPATRRFYLQPSDYDALR